MNLNGIIPTDHSSDEGIDDTGKNGESDRRQVACVTANDEERVVEGAEIRHWLAAASAVLEVDSIEQTGVGQRGGSEHDRNLAPGPGNRGTAGDVGVELGLGDCAAVELNVKAELLSADE